MIERDERKHHLPYQPENHSSASPALCPILSRRELLLSGAAAAGWTLFGCGGGNGNGGNGGGGPLSEDERAAALEAVRAKFASLPRTDRDADAREMLAFLQSRPEFVQSGIADDLCIWGTFRDGRPHVILNNEFLDDGRAASGAPARFQRSDPPVTRNVPFGHAARLFWTYGPFEAALRDLRKDTALLGPGLQTVLSRVGSYDVYLEDGGSDYVKLRAPRAVEGDAILFTATHGGSHGSGPNRFYNLALNDLYDKQRVLQDPALADDMTRHGSEPPAVVTMHIEVITGPRPWPVETRLAITRTFVRKYLHFAPRSLWVNTACWSFAQDFYQACFEKGLSCYAGWTYSVHRDQPSFHAALLLFDRMAGANVVNDHKSDPPHRPFPIQSVFGELKQHNLDHEVYPESYTDSQGKPRTRSVLAQFKYAFKTETHSFGLLAPSIRRLYVGQGPDAPIARTDRLWIEGYFGTEADPGPGVRSVTLGGRQLTVWQWSAEKLLCDHPADPDAAGPCLVTIRGHKSNAAYLTLWKGRFTITWNPRGTLFLKLVLEAHFRHDLRTSRLQAGGPLIGERDTITASWTGITVNSVATLSAGGSYTDPSGYVSTWSLNTTANQPIVEVNTQDGVVGVAAFDEAIQKVTFAFECTVKQGLRETVTSPFGAVTHQDLDMRFGTRDNPPTVTLGAGGAIPGGKHTVSHPDGGTVTVEWPSFAPVAGTSPDPSAGRSVSGEERR